MEKDGWQFLSEKALTFSKRKTEEERGIIQFARSVPGLPQTVSNLFLTTVLLAQDGLVISFDR